MSRSQWQKILNSMEEDKAVTRIQIFIKSSFALQKFWKRTIVGNSLIPAFILRLIIDSEARAKWIR